MGKFATKNDIALSQYYKELKNVEQLNDNKLVIALCKEYKETGDERIKERVLKSHLLYVVKEVNKQYHQYLRSDIYEDLINEGNMGLIEAFENFNPELNIPFVSYAHAYIYKYIYNFITITNDLVIQPANRFYIKKCISEAKMKLNLLGNQNPDVIEIISKYNEMRDKLPKMSIDLYHSIYGNNTVSFDKKINDTDDLSVGDTFGIEDDGVEIENSLLINKLAELLNHYELSVVLYKFDLNKTGFDYTFSQIGEKIGLTSSRASQIYNKAIEKLKEHKEIITELI